jgi:hypothetical protein
MESNTEHAGCSYLCANTLNVAQHEKCRTLSGKLKNVRESHEEVREFNIVKNVGVPTVMRRYIEFFLESYIRCAPLYGTLGSESTALRRCRSRFREPLT